MYMNFGLHSPAARVMVE